jgi:hypothetical protein
MFINELCDEKRQYFRQEGHPKTRFTHSLSDAGSSRHHRPAAEAVDPDGVFDHPLLRQKQMRYYIMQGLFDAAFPVFHLTIELCRLPSHTTTAKNGIRVYDCPHLNATAE